MRRHRVAVVARQPFLGPRPRDSTVVAAKRAPPKHGSAAARIDERRVPGIDGNRRNEIDGLSEIDRSPIQPAVLRQVKAPAACGENPLRIRRVQPQIADPLIPDPRTRRVPGETRVHALVDAAVARARVECRRRLRIDADAVRGRQNAPRCPAGSAVDALEQTGGRQDIEDRGVRRVNRDVAHVGRRKIARHGRPARRSVVAAENLARVSGSKGVERVRSRWGNRDGHGAGETRIGREPGLAAIGCLQETGDAGGKADGVENVSVGRILDKLAREGQNVVLTPALAAIVSVEEKLPVIAPDEVECARVLRIDNDLEDEAGLRPRGRPSIAARS